LSPPWQLPAAVAVTGCGHVMMMMPARNVARPAEAEFGIGPRTSASRQFTATLQPDQPLRPRRMQTVRVAIADAPSRFDRYVDELQDTGPRELRGKSASGCRAMDAYLSSFSSCSEDVMRARLVT
jgi:hypothetical protein